MLAYAVQRCTDMGKRPMIKPPGCVLCRQLLQLERHHWYGFLAAFSSALQRLVVC